MSQNNHFLYQKLTHLGGIPIEIFLRDYWQKKPLLVRQAFANFQSPLSAEELAGLSLDDDVVSRLVIENPTTDSWSVSHGPLPESKFSELPESHWTLLVQHADSLDPEVNELLHAFRFIPNWRLDDIMVSYATDKGGVGPHFDYYDVFLLQGEGKRRWKLGQQCQSGSKLVPNQPMKILQEFETTEEYIVEPGDLLYVPAQLAHWGEAIGESITYSIGFRAPSHADTLLDFSQEMASYAHEDDRYADPNLQLQEFSGQISDDAVSTLQQLLMKYWNDKARIAYWIGEYSTRLKQDYPADSLETVSKEAVLSAVKVKLSAFCRCAYYESPHQAVCFINGDSWNCSIELARALSSYEPFDVSAFSGEDSLVIKGLAGRHFLIEA